MSSAEPDCNLFPYAGWLPTANGRLSFRHIGETRHPNEATYANVTTRNSRYILAYQLRDLSDQLFQLISHFFFRTEERFYFAIAAETVDPPERAEVLKGSIHVYKAEDEWLDKARNIVDGSIDQINNIRTAIDKDRDEQIEKNFEQATERLKQTADIRIDFILWRTGEVFFRKPTFLDKGMEERSVKHALSLMQDFLKWVADQSYFFLRDLTHRHQHHGADADTILILQDHKDDIGWRSNILYSLHHYIIRSKRFSEPQSLYRCVGVLAYASSFNATCTRFLADRNASIPQFNEDELLQSLNARIGEQETKISEDTLFATKRLGVRAVWLAILAIIAAIIVMFLQPKIEKEQIPELKLLGDFLADNVRQIAWIAVIFFGALWVFTSDVFIRRRFVRDVLEASNVRRTGASYLMLFIAATVFLFSYWIGFDAVKDLANTIGKFWRTWWLI